jgi:PAS domain S-box-containing protein
MNPRETSPSGEDGSASQASVNQSQPLLMALRASEARSRAILDAASDAIALSDRVGTVLTVNPAYLELYGYDAAEVIGHSFAIIFPEAQRAWAEEQHRAIFDQPDTPQVNEARVRRKDGTERVVEVRAGFVVENGERTALVSAIRDVTERQAAEAALRASEERLRLALDAAGMGVYSWDPATDRTDADAALLAMLGIRPGEALSLATALDAHIHPADRARYGAAVDAMLDPAGSGRLEEEVRWRDDGGERWLAFTGQAFFASDGVERRAVRTIASVVDVTARKHAELERQTFAASAAHDLRTPLTSIMGQTQLLLRRMRRGAIEPARLESGLVEINAAALRMLALIDEVMDAARLDAGQALELQRAPTDLAALVERIVEELRSTTTRHRLRVIYEEPSLVGQWDSARLGRVVGNLLANAIKYSPDGGEIVVRIRRDDTGRAARAVLSVTDRGVGIPAHDLPDIFERFRRGINVTDRISGTGIGLAGASRIVEQHGGAMQVDSQEGEGSTFTVTLPLSLEPEPGRGG